MSPTEGCATKGMSLLTLNERETTTKRSKPRKRDIGRIRVKGFSIDLPQDDVESALRKHFSSCGEITDVCVHVLTDNLLSDRGFIYFLGGQGTVDKAMQLSGTDVGGWNVIVEPYPFLENADWDPVAFVQGYDTGLGKTEIKRMLFNHFSSCGQIMDIEFHKSTIGVASVYLYGEGAEDKVLDLDGSYMGGCKILVKHIITNGIYTVHPRRRHYGWPSSRRMRRCFCRKEGNNVDHLMLRIFPVRLVHMRSVQSGCSVVNQFKSTPDIPLEKTF